MENALIGQHARLKTGTLAAILRPPWHQRGGEARRASGRWRSSSIFGNRLTPRTGQVVAGLSYANRRRIEIARALASRPRILLLDEPTAGMNPGRDAGTGGADQEPERAGADGAADRAQAGCGDHAGGHGLRAGPWRGDRARQARRGAARRGGAARLSRPQRAGVAGRMGTANVPRNSCHPLPLRGGGLGRGR